MILVDTSVLVDFFRGRDTAAARALERLESTGTPFAIPTVCCQEILQGARDEREWKILRRYLETQNHAAPRDPWLSCVDAARIYFDCRRRGVTVRSSVDCLVAQLALESGGPLLHDDQDFENIRTVRPLKTLRG